MGTINPLGKEITSVSTMFCGRELTLEVNRVGFRSDASVIVRYGETVVLGTAMVGKKPLHGFDYFPLSVEYEERFYAAGKISGSRFIKREGRPSEDAILIGRIIDRPIRPLWPKGFRHEAQGIATVLSMDPTFRPDAIAMLAVSTAFLLTGAPFDGPVAGLRIGMRDGKLTPFASREELTDNDLDVFVAAGKGGIMMVEAGANEVAEETIFEAFELALKELQPALAIQEELVKKLGIKPMEFELSLPAEDVQGKVDAFLKGKMGAALRGSYTERHEILHGLLEDMKVHLREELGEDEYAKVSSDYHDAYSSAVNKDVRTGIIQDGVRPDGRKFTEIRPLSSEVGFLPRTHGSSLFTRGVTQAMNITTLAPLSFAQMLDTMEFAGDKRYMHHFNAPGYTVGEIKRLGSPGRREIGHSALAERALLPVIPSEADFPYTIRTVTEIMSQHGSTSMAATCSSVLSMMDAGVPLKAPVSGIAMGLLWDEKNPVILSDIQDAEDFAGDMDFKVTGTKKGVTAMQMDMKVHGLPTDILVKTVMQAKEGRAFILAHMMTTLDRPRAELSPYAPRVESIQINPDKIREVIGKGGEMINKIIAETGATIDIQDDGTVYIASPDGASIEAAKKRIRDITQDPEVGSIYENVPVVSVLDFGAFVQIMPGRDGMVHVSEISEERINNPSDVLSVGDKVNVKLVAIDEKGRLNLSIKQAERELKN